MILGRALLAAVCGVALACDPDEDSHDADDGSEGSSSGGLAPCEEQPTITYDTFGRGFLSTYCDGCHGSQVADRHDAPPDVVFDTRAGAEMFADRILARAAPPDGGAATMPPVGGVTLEDRDRLTVWLTCGP